MERRGGVYGLRGLRSESNRSISPSGEEGRVGDMERLRLGERAEEVGLVFGSDSHGIVLGGIFGLESQEVMVVYTVSCGCRSVQVLGSFSLTSCICASLRASTLKSSLGCNMSRDVAPV